MSTNKFFKNTFVATIFMIFVMTGISARAAQKDVILRAVAWFDTVVLNGDVTVEIDYSDQYAGYIVYTTDDGNAPRLKCHNEENILFIEGSKETSAVSSRVRVVCSTSLKTIVNAASGRIIVPNYDKGVKTLSIVNSGSGDIGLRRFEGERLEITAEGSGRVGVKRLCVDSLDITNTGSGVVYARGKANEENLVNTGTGNIVVFRVKAKSVTAVASGEGSIKCRYKNSLKASATSFGDIIYFSKSGKPGKNITAIESRAGNGKPHIYPSDFKKK